MNAPNLWDDPAVASAPTAAPNLWEDVSGTSTPAMPSGQPGTGTSAGELERSSEYPNAKMTDPTAQDAMTIYGTGQLAKLGIEGATASVRGITSLWEVPESLKSAGVTGSTLEHMSPGGQNPGDYVNAVEKQLSAKGVLATTAKETWDKMAPAAKKVGEAVTEAMNNIKQAAGPEALLVDANTALDPIANEALKRGTGLFAKTENLANPFYDAYDGLQKIAREQGGKLTLDNINAALHETGQMMNEGGEAVKTTFAKLYGKLADVRDVIVNTVANQAENPELKQALLKNNADYSTYTRILPSVEKAAYKEAIKEGVSAYQKHIGPLGEKLAIAGGSYAVVRGILDKVLGNK